MNRLKNDSMFVVKGNNSGNYFVVAEAANGQDLVISTTQTDPVAAAQMIAVWNMQYDLFNYDNSELAISCECAIYGRTKVYGHRECISTHGMWLRPDTYQLICDREIRDWRVDHDEELAPYSRRLKKVTNLDTTHWIITESTCAIVQWLEFTQPLDRNGVEPSIAIMHKVHSLSNHQIGLLLEGYDCSYLGKTRDQLCTELALQVVGGKILIEELDNPPGLNVYDIVRVWGMPISDLYTELKELGIKYHSWSNRVELAEMLIEALKVTERDTPMPLERWMIESIKALTIWQMQYLIEQAQWMGRPEVPANDNLRTTVEGMVECGDIREDKLRNVPGTSQEVYDTVMNQMPINHVHHLLEAVDVDDHDLNTQQMRETLLALFHDGTYHPKDLETAEFD